MFEQVVIRASDREASERFHDEPDNIRLSNGNGSFTIVAGTPTENADVTFL